MRAPILHGRIIKGRIKLDNPQRIKDMIATLEGERIELILRKHNPGKTDRANGYYRGVVVPLIAEDLGYDSQECHKKIKEQFGVISTSKMKTDEFSKYLDGVIRWAEQDLNIRIPPPHSVDY